MSTQTSSSTAIASSTTTSNAQTSSATESSSTPQAPKPAAKEKKAKNPMVAPIAGSISGVVETIVVWPMEYIKTQLQLVNKAKNPPFTGMASCAKYIFQNYGFFAFYRGMFPVLIGSIPKAGIRFGLYDYIVETFAKRKDGTSTPLRTLGAGMIAGGVEAALIVTPIETVKTRTIHANEGLASAMSRILRTEGPRGVYKGALATIGKQSSNQGLRFMAFEQYKGFLTGGDKKRKLSTFESLMGGMFAGCFSTLLNNPFDMVKTRMQGEDAKRYRGMIDCMRVVVKEEGFLALWNGVVPRLGRVVPGQGTIFMTYESITQFVEKNLV